MKKSFDFYLLAIFLAMCISFVSCSKNKEMESVELAIGQAYQGGIIAYIDETGEHGLIAALQDQSGEMPWCYGTSPFPVTGATATEIGTGKSNTEKIVQVQGEGNYAAKSCADLVIDSYNDWFLPSRDELQLLYQSRAEIGGFNYTNSYFSSSERGLSSVWYVSFSTGFQEGIYKDKSTYGVRAVRYF